MKETGLMFKAPLVRAILSGQKTQTRRVVKWKDLQQGLNLGFSGLRATETASGWVLESNSRTSREWRCKPTPCPQGQPGDRIYVRETFWAWGLWETRFSQAKGRDEWHFVDMTLQSGRTYEFHDPLLGKLRRRGQTGPGPTWWKRPGILMPKAAARIWLEVTSVRAERLQSISEADCWREGIEEVMHDFDNTSQCEMAKRLGCCIDDAKPLFAQLWESTGARWDDNPWVWVIDFKTISTTGLSA